MLRRVALRWVFLAVVAAGVAGACSSGTGSSGSPPAGTASAPADPGQWIGTITYRFAGNATGQRDEEGGYSYPGTYDDNATYTVVLGRDSSTSSGVSWSVVSGTATGSVNDDLLEINQGTTQRTTWNGQDSVGMPQGSCRLSFSTDRRSYSIECTRVRFDNVQWVNYEPNDPGQIYDGPNTGIWFAPQFSLTDISMPAHLTGLTGSRKATVWVQTASGPDVQVQADVSWDLTPGSATAPSAPPDITGSVKVNDPPYPVSITHPGQRVVVGFPVLAGQKVTVRVTGNMIGAVKVSLIKPGGQVVVVSSSSASNFDLLA